MVSYAIKDLERISGIKAHTLRIWEKRYNILQPKRTESNIRYYGVEDLKKVLNIAILRRHGVKISKIVDLTPEEISARVLEITLSNSDERAQIENLIISMIELDEGRFEKVFANCTLRLGLRTTMLEVIHPFIIQSGLLWQTGAINPGQEHFISNLIRQKIIVAIDHEKTMKNAKGKQFLFFLPEGELHELGILFYNYLIRHSGCKSIYIGQTTPIEEAALINIQSPSDYVVTSINATRDKEEIEEIISTILVTFPKAELILTNRIDFVPQVTDRLRFHYNISVEALDELLQS